MLLSFFFIFIMIIIIIIIIIILASAETAFRPKSLFAVFSGDGLMVGHLKMTAFCITAYGRLVPLALIHGSEEYGNLQVLYSIYWKTFMLA